MQENRCEWFKSSYSMQNGDCIEARNRSDNGIDIRDSKTRHGPILTFGSEARLSFVTAVKGQELGPAWFKSSYSAQNGACVEARNRSDSGMDLRDSKNPHGPILTFGPEARLSFVTAVKSQELGTAGRFPS